ncbi:MAG: aromatic ring-hydroxylating dioxygenase subunit alpha [Alphaproteobacteria bacterium]|jgi:carnitine monooxygenase subunit|nr:aromatic ring-hydroxylating dioxygenase subunit alpha [Rhodospirillaceae bacterium]MBT7646006.1 aromatic ring-hydroxylating dioxygenase subunit alpha [Rhodospirillaceae bacterium]MDG2479664.1 aromatic ring-hydroxylating dioxygenase subunit alpha [Alphaproteobacteria bacterium]
MASFTAMPVTGFQDDPMRSQTMAAANYFDPAIYEREKAAVFYGNWQYVGHVSMLPEPGNFIVRDIHEQSVVVLRRQDGSLTSYFNVCQHRAHRLLEGEGKLGPVLTCPYHGWAYGQDGVLRTARGRENEADFDTDAYCLESIRLGEMLGFIFVNLDGTAPDFETVTAGIRAEIAEFSPNATELKCADRSEYLLQANWKNSVENYDECFHCPNQHRTLIEEALDYDTYRITTHEFHHSHRTRGKNVAYSNVTDGAAKPKEFASLFLFPNWVIEAYPGGNLTVFHHVPDGPETTSQKCEWYFPHETPTSEERGVIEFVHEVRLEDIPLCESVQKGLHSLGYKQGRFHVDADRTEVSEHAVHDFQAKWLQAMGER